MPIPARTDPIQPWEVERLPTVVRAALARLDEPSENFIGRLIPSLPPTARVLMASLRDREIHRGFAAAKREQLFALLGVRGTKQAEALVGRGDLSPVTCEAARCLLVALAKHADEVILLNWRIASAEEHLIARVLNPKSISATLIAEFLGDADPGEEIAPSRPAYDSHPPREPAAPDGPVPDNLGLKSRPMTLDEFTPEVRAILTLLGIQPEELVGMPPKPARSWLQRYASKEVAFDFYQTIRAVRAFRASVERAALEHLADEAPPEGWQTGNG